MNNTTENSTEMLPEKITITPPSFLTRIFSIWLRHYKVYTNNIISNGFPPFLEPLIFLLGLGFGLGKYVTNIKGFEGFEGYLAFLATGIIIPSAMYTSAFECSYGTFIRLEYQRVYDGMVSASMSVKDLFIGEIIFAGTKGFFFSAAVLTVVSLFGLIPSPMAILSPISGLLTGLMFGAFSLYVTSFIRNINHFSFYFTGMLTPMFFFSGIVFPLQGLDPLLQGIAEIFPLIHSVNIVRAFCINQFEFSLVYDFLYMIIFTIFFFPDLINLFK